MATDESKVFRASGSLETYNLKSDAPTIYADAVQGLMISEASMKVSFVEHFLPDDGELTGEPKARYVLNLVMPFPQLAAMGALFVTLAAEAQQKIDAAKAEQE